MARAVWLVFQEPFLFEPCDHDADGGLAGRVCEARADFIRRSAILQRKDGIHNFPLTAGKQGGVSFGRRHLSDRSSVSDTRRFVNPPTRFGQK